MITAGYSCTLNLHTLSIHCEIAEVKARYDEDLNGWVRATYGESYCHLLVKITASQAIVVEALRNSVVLGRGPLSERSWLGRFALRDDSRTVGFGSVTKIVQTGEIS